MALNDMQEISTKVVTTISEVLTINAASIKPESTFDQLGADSIDMLEIIMKMQEKFDIEISDEQASHIKTVQEAIDAIYSLKAK